MIVLSNVKSIYTGAGDQSEHLLVNQDVVVKNGLIDSVAPHDPALNYSTDFRILDCSNVYIAPGLIDCHSHITMIGLDEEAIKLANSQANLLYVERILYQTLVHGGVTSIREIGGATHFIKRMVDQGVMIGPRMKIAIAILSSTGGHLDFCGPDRCHGDVSPVLKAGPGRPSSIVDGPWEARKRVRELAACGADLVKLCTSPGVASPNDGLDHEDLGREEIEAIVDEAYKRGMKVAAHAHTRLGIRMAIEGGVQDIQHISFMDDELAALAHKHNCRVTPTSWVLEEYLKVQDVPEFVQDKLHRVAEAHGDAVKAAYHSGLPILAGTDPFLPGMHGQNYRELAALHREGVPGLTTWYGATGLAAREIGQDDTGVIAPGFRADILVLSDDVFSDPGRFTAHTLLEVFKDGSAHRGHWPELPVNDFSASAARLLPAESTGELGVKLPR